MADSLSTGAEGIPKEDCLDTNFFSDKYASLTDRQRIQWALQTENRVRFQKLEDRDNYKKRILQNYRNNKNDGTTLRNSEHLINLYPEVAVGSTSEVAVGSGSSQEAESSYTKRKLKGERLYKRVKVVHDNEHLHVNDERPDNRKQEIADDIVSFQRKANPYYRTLRDADETFVSGAVSKIDFTSNQKDEIRVMHARGKDAIPPNLLFFQILIEGIVGYKFLPASFFGNYEDISMPKGAIMGGNVLAALTAWRDEHVQKLFVDFEPPSPNASLINTKQAKEYLKKKKEVILEVNKMYLFKKDFAFRGSEKPTRTRPFSAGDVDIFVEPSLQTQLLLKKLTCDVGLNSDVMNTIEEFVGGSGFVHNDLNQFARKLCLLYMENKAYISTEGFEEDEKFSFVYAQGKNGLSLMLTECNDYTSESMGFWDSYEGNYAWPRTTQIIMLSEKADLLGGLMDFDISVVGCSYDGVGVYLTPRAAFSVITSTQVISPFVLEEKRNRQRIMKYYKRGFDAYMVDPYCFHAEQCVDNIDTTFRAYVDVEDSLKTAQSVGWRGVQLHDDYDDLLGEVESYKGEKYQCCCQLRSMSNYCRSVNKSTINAEESGRRNYPYATMLFEEEEDDAVEYFSKRFNWTEEEKQKVISVPRAGRYSCLVCREEYATQLVLKATPSEFIDDAEIDPLHANTAYTVRRHYRTWFNPSFYECGAFNSKFAGSNAKTNLSILSQLHSQQIAEKARYILKNRTDEGFFHRFVFGMSMDNLHKKALNIKFAKSSRPPVGLNPERFIEKCEHCEQWLHNCEFGTKLCTKCTEASSRL